MTPPSIGLIATSRRLLTQSAASCARTGADDRSIDGRVARVPRCGTLDPARRRSPSGCRERRTGAPAVREVRDGRDRAGVRQDRAAAGAARSAARRPDSTSTHEVTVADEDAARLAAATRTARSERLLVRRHSISSSSANPSDLILAAFDLSVVEPLLPRIRARDPEPPGAEVAVAALPRSCRRRRPLDGAYHRGRCASTSSPGPRNRFGSTSCGRSRTARALRASPGFGWGAAWVHADGRLVHLPRHPGLPRRSGGAPMSARVETTAALVHLRRPSKLSTLQLADTQPFDDPAGRFSFSHNGDLRECRRARRGYQAEGRIHGRADTEVGRALAGGRMGEPAARRTASRALHDAFGGQANLALAHCRRDAVHYAGNTENPVFTFRLGRIGIASTGIYSLDRSLFQLAAHGCDRAPARAPSATTSRSTVTGRRSTRPSVANIALDRHLRHQRVDVPTCMRAGDVRRERRPPDDHAPARAPGPDLAVLARPHRDRWRGRPVHPEPR